MTLRAVPAPLVRGERGRLTLAAEVKGQRVEDCAAYVYKGEGRREKRRGDPSLRFKPCDGRPLVFLYPHEIIDWEPFQ